MLWFLIGRLGSVGWIYNNCEAIPNSCCKNKRPKKFARSRTVFTTDCFVLKTKEARDQSKPQFPKPVYPNTSKWRAVYEFTTKRSYDKYRFNRCLFDGTYIYTLSHKKILCFVWVNETCQFTAMPFRLTINSRLFTNYESNSCTSTKSRWTFDHLPRRYSCDIPSTAQTLNSQSL